ncbi:gTPase, IMAP member 8, partial [Serendipita sp. 398]
APTVQVYSAQDDGITQADKIVIVIGLPGAGKSTFVNYATGGNGEGIGHGIVVGTKSITICKTIVEGQSFAFVDTPGLDDVNKLDRILYMHRISDNRLTASPLDVLEKFAALCGNSAMPNVTMVTTMWSLVKDNIGNEREEGLRKILKSRTTTVQCRIARFGDDEASARSIILEQ